MAKAAKKASKAKKTETVCIGPASMPRKSVDIKTASNGFVVSSWNKDKEVVKIAKTKKEASKYASEMLGV